VGEGCQVQVYTRTLLTLGTGSRYSGSTGGVSWTVETNNIPSNGYSAGSGFPTLAEVVHSGRSPSLIRANRFLRRRIQEGGCNLL